MTAPIHRRVVRPLDSEVERTLERLARLPSAVRVAVMPDCHLAHEVSVGTVLALRDQVAPVAVGGDIGCGMAAIAFDTHASELSDPYVAARLLSGLEVAVPVLKHPTPRALPDTLHEHELSDPRLRRRAERDGALQLGTVGRGNHFVELQADEEDRLWLMVHSGSRAMGGAIRDHHRRVAGFRDRPPVVGEWLLDPDSSEGQAYLQDHAWALAYADANREHIVERVTELVLDVLGAAPIPDSQVRCHHNHVRRETHFGEELLVHRKGAIRADEGLPGIVPGSMGTASYHTLGRGHPELLRSSSHGAGRVMSRTEARRRIGSRAFRQSMEGVWYDHRKERRLRDEAPHAYRDIDAVMRAQRDLTRVVRRLRPLLSYKGT